MPNELITLASIEQSYPILCPGSAAAKLLQTNLQGSMPALGDLNRIKFPGQGAVKWTVATVAGEELVPYLEGIMLANLQQRSYWADPNPTNAQPDCFSRDCKRGEGKLVDEKKIPGHCNGLINEAGETVHPQCPFNVFGTAVKQGGGQGRGKACKERILVFLLRAGQSLPDIVSIPASSIRAFLQWRFKLPVAYYDCIVRFQLEKATSKDNMAYSKLLPFYRGPLDLAAQQGVASYKQLLQAMFDQAERSSPAPQHEDFE